MENTVCTWTSSAYRSETWNKNRNSKEEKHRWASNVVVRVVDENKLDGKIRNKEFLKCMLERKGIF